MGDPVYDFLGGLGQPSRPTPKKPDEKGVPWEAKIIDGAYYVPLRQVAELLAANDALPAVRKGIEARVQAQAERTERGL